MNKEKLLNLIKEIGLKLDDEKVNKFALYESLLLEWNNKFNLTAILDEDGILLKHFTDSIFPAKFIDFSGKALCDIGTGAGFPGIPLAIYNSSLRVTLVESNGKKIQFLNEVKKQLKLDNIDVVQSRAEDYKNREAFDYVSARAVTQLNVLSELAIPLLKIEGKLIALKLFDCEEEINNAKHALKVLDSKIEKIEKYVLPNSEEKRSLIVVQKMSRTKNKYPRNFAEISKSPL